MLNFRVHDGKKQMSVCQSGKLQHISFVLRCIIEGIIACIGLSPCLGAQMITRMLTAADAR